MVECSEELKPEIDMFTDGGVSVYDTQMAKMEWTMKKCEPCGFLVLYNEYRESKINIVISVGHKTLNSRLKLQMNVCYYGVGLSRVGWWDWAG